MWKLKKQIHIVRDDYGIHVIFSFNSMLSKKG